MRKVLKSLVSLLVIATMLLSMASVSFASNAETAGEIVLSTNGIEEVTFGDETFTGVAITVTANLGEFDLFAGWEEGKVSYDSSLFELVGVEPLVFYDEFSYETEWTLFEYADHPDAAEVKIGLGEHQWYPMGTNEMAALYFKVKDGVEFTGQTVEFVPSGKLIYVDYLENGNDFGVMENTTVKGVTVTLPAPAPAKYTVTYVIEGEVFDTQEYEEGQAIVAPEAPAKEGYTFAWSEIPATMPAEDITITGTYTEIPLGVETFNAGANATLTIDLETGAAVLSGTGTMTNFASATAVLWKEYKTQVTELTIADGITSIGNYAFDGFTGLTEVTLPSSVTSIGAAAFRDNTALAKITMPAVASIGNQAFNRDTALKTVIVSGTKAEFDAIKYGTNNNPFLQAKWTVTDSEGNVVYAGMHNNARWVYDEAAKKIEVYKNPSVTTAGAVAMNSFVGGYTRTPWREYMNSVEEVEVTGLSPIMSESFRTSSSLKNVIINEGTEAIWAGAFAYNPNLETITLPSTLTTLGAKAFYIDTASSSLKKVTVNMTLDQYRSQVVDNGNNSAFNKTLTEFTDCYRGYHSSNYIYWKVGKEDGVLTLMNYKSTNTAMASTSGVQPWADFKDQITKIVVPDKVTKISPSAFTNLDNVTEVQLGATVTEIGANAFSEMDGITSITIPRLVTTLGTSAFDKCSKLEEITLPKSVTVIGNYAFRDTNLKKIYYDGTPEEFAAITVRTSGNSLFKNAEVIYLQ